MVRTYLHHPFTHVHREQCDCMNIRYARTHTGQHSPRKSPKTAQNDFFPASIRLASEDRTERLQLNSKPAAAAASLFTRSPNVASWNGNARFKNSIGICIGSRDGIRLTDHVSNNGCKDEKHLHQPSVLLSCSANVSGGRHCHCWVPPHMACSRLLSPEHMGDATMGRDHYGPVSDY